MPIRTSALWRDRHWDAYLAHNAVGAAVRSGKLVPKPCEECGEGSVVAHHDDYAQRLTVRWLCQSHHRLWHIENPLTEVVPGPPRKAQPVLERRPNRGRVFRRYLKPRAVRMRDEGFSLRFIGETLGVSMSTVHDWTKENQP